MIDTHIRHMRIRGLRDSTITKRRYHLTRFTGHYPDIGAVTTDDIIAWLERPMSAKTRLTELSHLRSFYQWAVVQGLLDHDPTAAVESPRVPRYLPRPIGEGELQSAVGSAYRPVRTWLILAGWAGLRACEIAQLRAEAIDADGRLLRVEEGKGGTAGTVPICQTVADELEAAPLPTRGWLWTMPTDAKRHVTPSRVSKLCNDYLRAIGSGATLHQFRHRFGTATYAATQDLRATQELLRHQSPTTTAIYTKLSSVDLMNAIEQLPPAN